MSKLTISKNGIEIGYITWYEPTKEQDRTILKINFLNVNTPFQGQGYGNFLIICMMAQLGIRGPLEITLDDCSALAGTENCLYYKIGFRITDNGEEMSAYIKSASVKNNEGTPFPKFNSIEDFTQQIKNKISETGLSFNFKKYKFNEGVYDIIEDKDINMYRRLSVLNIIANRRECRNSFGKGKHKHLFHLFRLNSIIKYLLKI